MSALPDGAPDDLRASHTSDAPDDILGAALSAHHLLDFSTGHVVPGYRLTQVRFIGGSVGFTAAALAVVVVAV